MDKKSSLGKSKQSRENHENVMPAEHLIQHNKLKESLHYLISVLESEDYVRQLKTDSIAVARLIILYLQLESKGAWGTEEIRKHYSAKLNRNFKNVCGINLSQVLCSDQFNTQEIFDMCIRELHMAMTIDDYKTCPTLVKVYCLLIKDIKNYKININPVTVLPVALLLIDDHIPINKTYGLQSCTAILQCLSTETITAGNYYEVVYSSLKKNVDDEDKGVTQALCECFLVFLNMLPSDIKKIKLDDIFSCIVDKLYTETNLRRKAYLFYFTTKIIEMHGIHCVKKKLFKIIIYDNIDMCSCESVEAILLLNVLECLQTWLRYCWCVWRLSSDQKMLLSLFKMLYLTKNDNTTMKLQNIIITLIKLCSKDEQSEILENLEEPLPITNEAYLSRLDKIRKQINVK